MSSNAITRERIEETGHLIRPYIRRTPILRVDRRDFGVGADAKDEGSLGFSVGISFELTATRS